MAIGENTKKINTLILTDSFIIRGEVTVPNTMRFSDAINKFLKNQVFIAVTNAEITLIYGGTKMEERDFILINKDQIVAISPND
jgi:hypothetical protein